MVCKIHQWMKERTRFPRATNDASKTDRAAKYWSWNIRKYMQLCKTQRASTAPSVSSHTPKTFLITFPDISGHYFNGSAFVIPCKTSARQLLETLHSAAKNTVSETAHKTRQTSRALSWQQLIRLWERRRFDLRAMPKKIEDASSLKIDGARELSQKVVMALIGDLTRTRFPSYLKVYEALNKNA